MLPPRTYTGRVSSTGWILEGAGKLDPGVPVTISTIEGVGGGVAVLSPVQKSYH